MNTLVKRRGLAACFLPGVHGRGVGLSSSRPRATIYHDRAAWDMGVPATRRAGTSRCVPVPSGRVLCKRSPAGRP